MNTATFKNIRELFTSHHRVLLFLHCSIKITLSIHLKSKLPNVGTTIFTVMSKLANDHQAVNLSQGFPNFPVDPKLIQLVNKHMSEGRNQYAPMPGVPVLREAIVDKANKLCGSNYDSRTDITVTAGATQAIFTAITALVHPGDEVMLFSPAYDCYEPAIELNGGKTVHINLSYPDYAIPWEEVKSRISTNTRMIIVNTPHNPCGTIMSERDMTQLDELTRGTDILVLSDEVYEHIIFDGNKHQSAARFPELRKRSLIVASFGKTFHATGWKMGYILGPENLMEEFRKVHQFNVFSCNAPSQYALAEYIGNEDNYLKLPAFYQAKRDFFLDKIKNSRFEFIPSSGSYFQLLRYSEISGGKDTVLAMKWTIENKIASIPVSVFYPDQKDEKVLRFCFAKTEDVLDSAAKILNDL